MKTKALIMTLCGATILLMALCGRNPGSGTETGNGLVTAMLHNPGGSPAKHATVYFYPVNYNPRTGGLGKTAVTIDSTTTDTNGNFTITLPADTYTMQASGDSGLAFQDSITAVKDSTVRPDQDTLRPAGSIRGVVRLEEGGDPRTIFILFMGTRTFTWPDDTLGNFTSGPMAAGHYRVRLITTTPDYLPLDDTLTVTAGKDDTLADTIVLKYNGIPIPKNVRIVYDTLKQIVTLMWDSASASLVSSYNVYRKNVGLNTVLARINTSPVTGTRYMDSTGAQDSTYEYSVSAVNASASEGVKSATVRVTVVSGYITVKTIDSINGMRVRPAGLFIYNDHLFIADSWAKEIIEMDLDGNFVKYTNLLNRPNDLVIDNKGNYWIAEFSSNKVEKFDSNWTLQQTWSIFKNQAGDTTIITEPLRLAIDSNDNIYILYNSADFSAIKIDANGIVFKKWYIGGSNNNIAPLKNHQLAVAGGPSNILTIYDSTGALLKSVQLRIQLGPSTYSGIGSMAVDLDDNLYFNVENKIANPPPSQLYKFDANGILAARLSIEDGLQTGDMVISSSGEIFLGALFPGRIVIYSQRR